MKIRKKLYFFYKILFSFIIIIFALVRMQNSATSHKFGLEIFFEAIVIFGIFIKSILAYIFPEIILDNEGIKFIGRNKIKWNVAKSITIAGKGDEIFITIEKYNLKKITERIKNLNSTPTKLKEEIKRFAPSILMVQNDFTF